MVVLLSASRLRGSIQAAAVHTNTAGRTVHSKLTAWRFNNQ